MRVPPTNKANPTKLAPTHSVPQDEGRGEEHGGQPGQFVDEDTTTMAEPS